MERSTEVVALIGARTLVSRIDCLHVYCTIGPVVCTVCLVRGFAYSDWG